MKAEDLELYDWVLVDGRPLRVLALAIGNRYDAQPIPLSGEILARYGWELKSGMRVLKDKKARLTWNERSKELIVGYGLFPARIEYVHQLQHLLRLLDMKDMTV